MVNCLLGDKCRAQEAPLRGGLPSLRRGFAGVGSQREGRTLAVRIKPVAGEHLVELAAEMAIFTGHGQKQLAEGPGEQTILTSQHV